jgi:excisionase family DNA binding protein
MSENELPSMLKVEDVANYLRIGKASVYELCRQNKIPVFRVGKTIRIKKENFLNWISESNLQVNKSK